MRKVLFTLLLAVCTSCLAQTKHMKFKGIPMEGTVKSFVQKLKEKGFTYMGQQEKMTFLEGEFAARRGCTITVISFSDRDQVETVGVVFPEVKTWNSLTDTYYSLKNMLSEKYGIPYSIEKFSDGDPIDDQLRFFSLLRDECVFSSDFTCENGSITLTLKKMGALSASVFLLYIDNANNEESHQKAMDDL